MRKVAVLLLGILLVLPCAAWAGNIFEGVTADLPEGFQVSASWQGPYLCNEAKLEDGDSYLRIYFSGDLSLSVSASSSASTLWFEWANVWIGDRSHVSFQFNSSGSVIGFKVTQP